MRNTVATAYTAVPTGVTKSIGHVRRNQRSRCRNPCGHVHRNSGHDPGIIGHAGPEYSHVWMIEEKQTDVNIALHAYRDVARGVCDQVVICSNDSDLEPALRLIREDVPTATIGLIMPLRAHAKDGGKVPNKRLTPLAHWVRHHILDEELMRAQLPQNVPTKKKAASKPIHW